MKKKVWMSWSSGKDSAFALHELMSTSSAYSPRSTRHLLGLLCMQRYEKSFSADWKAVKKGLRKVRAEVGAPKKIPTSVALDPRFVAELKKEAQARGIPYQILMRMFIVEGFRRLKKKPA